MNNIYTKAYTVQPHDIDELNHVSNIKYVEWIQEISKEHWDSITRNTPLASDYYWVVANHNIDYNASAFLHQELIMETFVEKYEKAYSFRRVNVLRRDNHKTIMTALTKWCLFDRESHRICRITNEMMRPFILG
jgi:acyl-CoA thioester hydrolase